jgi:hypothetical protein
LIAKDVDITRIMSDEEQWLNSSSGVTTDCKDKNPALTPAERLQWQLKYGNKPHPIISLPDDGKFWCDPSRPNISHPNYCKYTEKTMDDMEKLWKEIFGVDRKSWRDPPTSKAVKTKKKFSCFDVCHSPPLNISNPKYCKNTEKTMDGMEKIWNEIYGDDRKSWCNPSTSKMPKTTYFLSCFDMGHPQWKEIYGDDEDIAINPSEIAANAYFANFSKVNVFIMYIISH